MISSVKMKYINNDGFNYFFQIGYFSEGKDIDSASLYPCSVSDLFQNVFPATLEYGELIGDYYVPANMEFVACSGTPHLAEISLLSDLVEAISGTMSSFIIPTKIELVYQPVKDMESLPTEYYEGFTNATPDAVGSMTPYTVSDWLQDPLDINSYRLQAIRVLNEQSRWEGFTNFSQTFIEPDYLFLWENVTNPAYGHMLSWIDYFIPFFDDSPAWGEPRDRAFSEEDYIDNEPGQYDWSGAEASRFVEYLNDFAPYTDQLDAYVRVSVDDEPVFVFGTIPERPKNKLFPLGIGLPVVGFGNTPAMLPLISVQAGKSEFVRRFRLGIAPNNRLTIDSDTMVLDGDYLLLS